jgi:hypothetical protein
LINKAKKCLLGKYKSDGFSIEVEWWTINQS